MWPSKRVGWWLLFMGLAAPSLYYLGLFIIGSRQLGIDPVETLLESFGLWALRILLLTLSVSTLSRLGVRALSPYRRMIGLFAFYYASLHLTTYLFGWIEWDLQLFAEDILERPFIYLGMLAWVLLLVLAVTSPKKMVKKLKRYWRPLHRLVYPAATLVVVHLWMQQRASALESIVYGGILLFLLAERAYRSVSKRYLVKSGF